MTPKTIVPPTEEPISIDEARAHLEAQPYYDSDTDPIDDTMIMGWVAAAREYCEAFLGLSLSPRTLEVALDNFPASARRSFICRTRTPDQSIGIELPRGPVHEILFVQAGDESDGPLDEALYILDDFSVPARVLPAGSAWPMFTGYPNAIRIRYLAGYGLTSSDPGEHLPWMARAAMLLMLGHLYANREDSTDVAMQTIPTGAEALLRPLRVRLGMA